MYDLTKKLLETQTQRVLLTPQYEDSRRRKRNLISESGVYDISIVMNEETLGAKCYIALFRYSDEEKSDLGKSFLSLPYDGKETTLCYYDQETTGVIKSTFNNGQILNDMMNANCCPDSVSIFEVEYDYDLEGRFMYRITDLDDCVTTSTDYIWELF